MKTHQFAAQSGLMVVAFPSVLFFLGNAEEIAIKPIIQRRPIVHAELEQPFTLRVGQSAQVESLGITFSRVVQDSRCPSDVVCVWAGDAAVELILTRPEMDRAAVTLHTTLTPKEAAVGRYLLRLVNVAPYPQSTFPIPARDYRVTLVVSEDSPGHDSEATE